MGKDVNIYSEHNTGRGYKLGYIAGINLCGLAFFGGAFWRPGRQGANGVGPTSAIRLDLGSSSDGAKNDETMTKRDQNSG
jgi:hypothetical protein